MDAGESDWAFCMQLLNRHSVPAPLVEMLSTDSYSKGPARISITELIDSPRIRVLREQHEGSMQQDVMDRLWLLLGRAWHEKAERSPCGIREERLYAEIAGWVISGAIDLQTLEDGMVVISDYKLTTARVIQSYLSTRGWEEQLNCYAFLVENNKHIPVARLEIYAILRDWSEQSAMRDPEYPQTPMVTIPIRLWSNRERLRYLEYRVRLHQLAEKQRMLGQRLPYCSADEMWMRGEFWRVAMPNQKRAIARAATEEEARRIQGENPGSEVTFIRGTPVRCRKWCLVRNWCDQYQEQQVFPHDGAEENHDFNAATT